MSSQYSLTPDIIAKKDGDKENPAFYPVRDIGLKLSDKNVKNIALTGPYGSGKSSVLLTLQEEYNTYNYLNISLATLECNKEVHENKEDNGEYEDLISNENKSSNEKTEDSLNRLIEYSILQQLIYREETKQIPQSRLKRIKHISNKSSWVVATVAILCPIAIVILFEPSFLRIDSFYRVFSVTSEWKLFFDITSFVFLAIIGVVSLKWIVINVYNSKLNKLNLKDGEIEIKENTSIFNKHLDEIIYFFQVTKYDVVIIEDLDRFKTHTIYLKLRELNNLLNSSKSICGNNKDRKRIVFIYAVRDDIFNDTSRAKFFDYITTVIPIINPSNSCNKLISSLKEHGITDIVDDTCRDLGVFIDDMRMLKNIVNEFIQYREKLDKKLAPAKLLAMVIYKNYHPKDFALLHNQDGLVYKVISNKSKYHNSAVAEKDKKIAEIKNEIKEIEKYQCSEADVSIRSRYVLKYIELNGYKLKSFILKGSSNATLPNDIINNETLFKKLMNNEYSQYYYEDYYNQNGKENLNTKFEDVEKQIGSKYSYLQRTSLSAKKIEELNATIEEIQQEILNYKALPLSEILMQYPACDFIEDVNDNRLIAFLLRRGYVDESFYDYISYFYEGIMTASDRDFILDIKVGITKPHDYKIQKAKAVITQVQDYSFKTGVVKNIDITDYLTDNKAECSKQYNWVIQSIKKGKEILFIHDYYRLGRNRELFFDSLLSTWSNFFDSEIINCKTKEHSLINYEIFLNYFNADKISAYATKPINSYIANSFSVINGKLNQSKITQGKVESLLTGLSIRFTSISGDNLNSTLMDFIIAKSLYSLNNGNIIAILKYLDEIFESEYNVSSYTTILKSQNVHLIENVNEDIECCICDIFPEESIEESEDSIIKILTNKEIEDDTKKAYLSKQINKIENIESIEKEFWENALDYNLIRATWTNLLLYIQDKSEINSLSQSVINFVNKNAKKLSEVKIKSYHDDEFLSNLFNNLIGTNLLDISSYKLIRNSFNYCFAGYDLSGLESERYEYLIETGAVEFNATQYSIAATYFKSLISKFILRNKAQYFKGISSYPLTNETAGKLLNSEELSVSDKYTVINSLSTDGVKNNASIIGYILLRIDLKEANKEQVLIVMAGSSKTDMKLKLFSKIYPKIAYDEQFVKSCLGYIGGEYAHIGLQKGHRPKLQISEDNTKLSEYLEKNKFISKQYEEKGMIRINCKNLGS